MIILGFGSKARNGKDTAAEAIKAYYDARRVQVMKHGLIARTPTVQIVKFADALYKECREKHGMTEKDPTLLQNVGEERRQQDPLYWIKQCDKSILPFADLVLITDMRHINEAAFVKFKKGYTVDVQRLNADGSQYISTDRDPQHITEIALYGYNFDYKIVSKDPVLTGEYAVTLAGYLIGLETKA